jgi:L-serine deaminase
MLKTDDQHAKDQEVLANIKRLSHDKDAKMRQLAEELLAAYTPE